MTNFYLDLCAVRLWTYVELTETTFSKKPRNFVEQLSITHAT